MPDFHRFTDMIVLPFWLVAALAVVALVFVIVAFVRSGFGQSISVIGQCAAVFLLFGLGWLYFDRIDTENRSERRRAIEAQIAALTAQAVSPNSALACLDNNAGDVVGEACEKSLFANPEQVAAAVAFVGARLNVLREIAALPDRDESSFSTIRKPLLQSLETDRYGFVAHVLEARDGCSAETCYAFDLMPHRDQVVANLKQRAYDVRVVRHAAGWGDKPGGPALASAPTAPYHPVNINFPTASSIPPVSIMANEPGMTGQTGMDAESKTEARSDPRAQTPVPARRPAAKPAAPRTQTTGAPVQITPQ